MDYYEKLKADFPTFGATLQLNERQQKSLDSLLSYTSGALDGYLNETARLKNPNLDLSEEHKTEQLKAAKSKSLGSIAAEFGKVQDRLPRAKSVLHGATHQTAAKDSTEALLRHMQGKEIREGLEKMPPSERVGVLQKACQDGDGSILWAVEGQSVVSDLVPQDDMDRAAEILGETMAPEQVTLVGLAKEDLEGATAIRNLAGVEIGHISEGL